MNIKVIALASMLSVAVAAQAQNIYQRSENQHDRIQQGFRSDQLTRGETRHLEGQDRAIDHEARDMREQDNGRLTRQDRRIIRVQQNQESRRIYRDRHNAFER